MDVCGLGICGRYSIVNVGYEDCNVDVQADAGRYLVKVFAAHRPAGLAARTVTIIEHAIAAGVAHPRLVPDRTGHTLHRDSPTDNEYIVMDYINGSTFYDLRRPPDVSELQMVVQQAVRVHSVDLSPVFVSDPWAVPNLVPLLTRVADHLDPHDRALAQRAVQAMRGVNAAALTWTLIHADMTKGNFIRTATGELAVLDFSVANRFPRIQELAVIAANLMHGDGTPLLARAQLVADLYSGHQPLSRPERQALAAYTFAAAAMEYLGAIYERHVKGNDSPETDYIMDLGRAGLHAGGAELDSI
jgi:Ser/Thr protein kinase RdoA (MazF antagonist)